MAEYIEREETKLFFINNFGGVSHAIIAARLLDEIPPADVAPVVHGRWENGNPICLVCGEDKFKDLDADIWADWQPPFCPNCGAKMVGDFCSYGEQE